MSALENTINQLSTMQNTKIVLTLQDFEKIDERAYRKFIKANSGIRGQTITEVNDLSWWIMLETVEYINNREYTS